MTICVHGAGNIVTAWASDDVLNELARMMPGSTRESGRLVCDFARPARMSDAEFAGMIGDLTMALATLVAELTEIARLRAEAGDVL